MKNLPAALVYLRQSVILAADVLAFGFRDFWKVIRRP
jgi:hypothetical protein